MAQSKFSRRKFLRVSGAAAAGALAAAYSQADRPMSEARQTAADGNIALDGGNADVWAWEKAVSGRLSGLGCESVIIRANGYPVAARVEGEQFSLLSPL